MLQGIVTQKQEWLYLDTSLGKLPDEIQLHTARNGKEGVQILLETVGEIANVKATLPTMMDAEIYQLIDIPVEYNTASATDQGGRFVIMDEQADKPFYCTRKAPFRVYDCLKPIHTSEVQVRNNRFGLYVCIVPQEEIIEGSYPVTLEIEIEEGTYTLVMNVQIYDVLIPTEQFSVTNWFSLNNIASKHELKQGSQAFLDMVRAYARAMRRTRQTHFFLMLDPKYYRLETEFNFDYIKPIAEIFFEEGFKKMEIGSFATQGDYMLTDELKCAADPTIKVSSKEGYWILTEMIRAWKSFLEVNKWENKVVYHICDEPDVHITGPESMVQRKAQYFMIANLLRKYLGNLQIIEAVKTDEFRGGIDIWVPLTVNYEELKDEFDKLKNQGNEVWNYVCCAPTGEYLNRFLDIPLLRSRLLFWGCSKYKLDGYLHWGLNHYGEGQDPFEQSCCPNPTGLGTSFPAGDAHIVYPGADGPWISMRLEAQRRGIEDLELLNQMEANDSVKYDELVSKIFTNNKVYEDNINLFEEVREKMLRWASR